MERQYQGSIDQRSSDLIEIETKKRPVSIRNKLEESKTASTTGNNQAVKKPGVFTKLADWLCGSNKEDRKADIESEGLMPM